MNPSPNNDRDHLMSGLLDLDGAPEHGSGFWSELDQHLDAEDGQIVALGSGTADGHTTSPPIADLTAERERRSDQRQRWGFPPLALTAAAALIAVSLITAGVLLNRDDPVGTVAVDVPPADVSGTDGGNDTGTAIRDAFPGELDESSFVPDQPGNQPIEETNPTQDTPAPLGTPTGSLPSSYTAGSRPIVEPGVRSDGSVPIAYGIPRGLSPDGNTALVMSVSPYGGSGCEGQQIHELWRIPLDGSTPTLAAPQGVTVDMGRLVVAESGKAAWIVGCDGYSSTIALADISPDGYLSTVERFSVSDQVSFDASAGKLGVLDIGFDANGALRFTAANGINAEAITYDGTTFDSTATDDFTLPPLAVIANERVTLEPEWDTGLVLARHTDPADGDFPFPGQAFITDFTPGEHRILALASDHSGAWIASPVEGNDCRTQLIFARFDRAEPTELRHDFASSHHSLTMEIVGQDVLVSAGCGDVRSAYLGSVEDLNAGTGFMAASPPLWRQFQNLVSSDAERVTWEVNTSPESSVTMHHSLTSGSTTVTGNEQTTDYFAGVRVYNSRFQFVIEVPPGWTVGPPPQNNDGRVLTHRSGAEVVVSGTFGVDEAFAQEPGFNALVSDQEISLLTGAGDNPTIGRQKRMDFSGSGVPLDFIVVITAAEGRAVNATARIPMNDDVARDAVETLLVNIDVHAGFGG